MKILKVQFRIGEIHPDITEEDITKNFRAILKSVGFTKDIYRIEGIFDEEFVSEQDVIEKEKDESSNADGESNGTPDQSS